MFWLTNMFVVTTVGERKALEKARLAGGGRCPNCSQMKRAVSSRDVR